MIVDYLPLSFKNLNLIECNSEFCLIPDVGQVVRKLRVVGGKSSSSTRMMKILVDNFPYDLLVSMDKCMEFGRDKVKALDSYPLR